MSRNPPLTNRFRELLRRERFWRGGEPILVAVSGGIDSMVLLDLIRRLPAKERPEPVAVHYNHNLRGEESDRDADFVLETCKGWGVPCETAKAPKWDSKNNLQEKARTLRYDFFRSVAERLKVFKIATAHQAEDQAETFLIRWIQGAGLKGLAGIPIKGPLPPAPARRSCGGGEGAGVREIVRPLIFISRDEIEGYAKRQEVPYREDQSNHEGKYLRNRVRRLLADLHKENPGLALRSSINAVLLRADQEFLEREVEGIPIPEEGFSISTYLKLPEALGYRILQKMANELEKPRRLGGDEVLKIDTLIRDRQVRHEYHLSGGVRFEKDYVVFRIAG